MGKLKYKDPKKLEAKIEEYFKACQLREEKVVLNNKRDSVNVLELPKIPLLGELQWHLGISHTTWQRWENDEVDFGSEEIAKRVRSILAHTRTRLVAALADAGACGRLPERLVLALLAQHGVTMAPEQLGSGGVTVNILNYGELSFDKDKLSQVQSLPNPANESKSELNED